MKIAWVLLGIAFIFASLPCRAAFTGLVVIPTADKVPAGHYYLELQTDGAPPTPQANTLFFNTEVGVNDRIEAGVDFDLHNDSGQFALLDAKYVFARASGGRLAAAAGIANVGNNSFSSLYAVVSRDLGLVRGHLGMIGSGGAQWFTGADSAVSDKVTLMADYTSGGENFASLGVSYQFDAHFSLLAGALFPNDGGSALFTMQLGYAGVFGR